MNRLTGLILVAAFAYASAQKCGGDLKGPSGNLTTPNYPSNYPNNAKCYWTITVAKGNTVEFEFLDFELEESPITDNCLSRDFVGFIDGEDYYGPWCGRTLIPSKITSKTNKIGIFFTSDESLSYRGFLARYKEISNDATTPLTARSTTKS